MEIDFKAEILNKINKWFDFNMNDLVGRAMFSGINLIGTPTETLELEKLEFSVVNFCVDIRYASISNSSFKDCRFLLGETNSVKFTNCVFENVVFSPDDLKNITFENCLLKVIQFFPGDYENIKFIGCEMEKMSYFDLEVKGLTIENCKITEPLYRLNNTTYLLVSGFECDNIQMEFNNFPKGISMDINKKYFLLKNEGFNEEKLNKRLEELNKGD